MPSKQSEAVKTHWTAARLAMEQPGAEQPYEESWGDLRGERGAEHPEGGWWGDLTAEPRAIDYLETVAGGLPAMWAVPKHGAGDRVLLCMPGGGFISGRSYSHRKMFGHLAMATGARALLFDYRLAPEHTHPAQVDDATAVYRWLLDHGISADHI